jgi:hypothetical protein
MVGAFTRQNNPKYAGPLPQGLTPINGDCICSRFGSADLVENDRNLNCAGRGCPRYWLDQPCRNLPEPRRGAS